MDISHSQILSPFQWPSRDKALIDLFKIPHPGSCQLKQDWSPDVLTIKPLYQQNFPTQPPLIGGGEKVTRSRWQYVFPQTCHLTKIHPFSPSLYILTYTWQPHFVSSLLSPSLALYLHPAFQTRHLPPGVWTCGRFHRSTLRSYSCALCSVRVRATWHTSHRDLGHTGG